MSAGGGCEAAVTARTRCGWDKLRKCSELLHGMRFSIKLKLAVHKSYVRPAILHRSEAWCLKESDIEILRTERSMERAKCGVQFKNKNRSTDLMLMLGLHETIDQLPMANSVRWYGHVLRREDGNVLRRALEIEVEGQRKKGRLKRTWNKQVEEESVKIV